MIYRNFSLHFIYLDRVLDSVMVKVMKSTIIQFSLRLITPFFSDNTFICKIIGNKHMLSALVLDIKHNGVLRLYLCLHGLVLYVVLLVI